MMLYSMLSILPFMITLILILINYYFSMMSIKDREKPSPFECGFNPLTTTRLPFSMHFFLTMIIFLVFDIELTLLTPMICAIHSPEQTIKTAYLILSILLIGLIYEWNEQSLLWNN